jgi:[histone H3]-lysine36 N-trimethyltransferase
MNLACGDNDCINFATSMECMDDECSCGVGCQNQRFQQRQYADVDVIQTDKKGYGIRANSVIPAHTFIYEYVGEVIEENAFRERMHDYDEQGIKHFYFMMIQQGEYIDATKKGGIGRFLNHSCAPNCYVDKWVVGTKLRMGIFADRNIQAGEELTFDYNVDRYGYYISGHWTDV